MSSINNNPAPPTPFAPLAAKVAETSKDARLTTSDTDTNIKLTSVSTKILEAFSKTTNAAKNFIATKISSTKESIGEIFSNFKDKLEDISNNKKIASLQKSIDNDFKELKELKKISSPLEESLKRIDSLEKKIDLSAAAIKMIKPSQVVFKQIAQGKAKMVFVEYKVKGDYLMFEHKFSEKNVYYAPVGANFLEKHLKQKEISDEIKTGWDIEKKLNNLESKETEKYIAIDMEVMKDYDSQKNGDYTVKTSTAEGDLKDALKNGSLEFPQSLKIGFHILKGMSNLHKAGYVHGDGKNDNVLLVKDEKGELIGRIADLGKTQKMKPDEKGIFVGNPRFAAPEGNLSHSGEIYTTALLIINTLEGELLNIPDSKGNLLKPHKERKEMLLPINDEEIDPKANAKERFGIEKFLLLNKNCTQTDNSTFTKKAKILGKEVETRLNSFVGKSNTAALLDAETQTHEYIDKLVYELADTHPEVPQDQFEKLGGILKEMTRAKVGEGEGTRTKTLEAIIPQYKAIMDSLYPSS
ncbi:MAG: protein kinase [Parachlamydiaceae bacterium]|nr:protein kinase [Parachlamydiaceae bacterium]